MAGEAKALTAEREAEIRSLVRQGWALHRRNALELLAEIDRLRSELASAREAALREAVPVAAALAAAISLLERGGKRAAPSDKMFDQMLRDYRRALEDYRALLNTPAAGAEGGRDG